MVNMDNTKILGQNLGQFMRLYFSLPIPLRSTLILSSYLLYYVNCVMTSPGIT